MDLKVVCVIACLCALALTPTEAGIPKCCISTRSYVSYRQLRKVYKTEKQSSSGACDIDALLLYVRGSKSPICASPKVIIKVHKTLSKLKA